MKVMQDLTEACFQNGYEMIKNKSGIALVGISLGNGYFNSEKINLLISSSIDIFDRIKIIITDDISMHNYKAIGLEHIKAEKIVRQKAQIIKNRCNKALKNMADPLKKPQILNWQEIEVSNFYQNELTNISSLYEQNIRFRNDMRECTKQVITTKLSKNSNLEEAINEGINYLLKELAFLMAGAQMFNCERVAFVYHKEWPFLQNFINGKYDNKIKNNIAYIIIS